MSLTTLTLLVLIFVVPPAMFVLFGKKNNE